MKYQNKNTVIHRMSPLLKIFYSIAVSVLIVVFKTPAQLSLLVFFVLVVFCLTKSGFSQIKTLFIIVFTVVATTMISQSIFYYFEPKTKLITLIDNNTPLIGWLTRGIYVYKEGLLYGAVQSLRVIAAMFMASTIVVTTHPSDMIVALNKMRVPKSLSFVISVSIRFLPQLIDETKRVFLAIRLKGLKVRGVKNSLRAYRLLLSPMIINSLRRARVVALAAEARGFLSDTEIADRKISFSFNTLELITIAFFIILLYVSILPFKMGLSKIPFLHTFFFSVPFTCVLFIGIRLIPKPGSAAFLICGHSLFTQIVLRGINPLWWPYALAESMTLEIFFLVTKSYLGSNLSAIMAGALRGLVVYLYFYFISAPFIWHRFYAPWYITIHTLEGIAGSAVGGFLGFRISRVIERAYKYGGI